MICPDCGTRLPTGQKDCHFCGYHISEQIIAMQTVETQNIANQAIATVQSDTPIANPNDCVVTPQSDPRSATPNNTNAVAPSREDDSNKLSLLALFIAMMAFVTTFANFYYQSTGESRSVSFINSTSNITYTTYFPKSFIVGGILLEGYVLSFLMAIFAFVVATIAWSILMHFSKSR